MPELLIRKLQVRDRLTETEKRVLTELIGPPREVAANEDFIREGDRPHESTLLLEGYTCRSMVLRDGQRQITSIHVPGDFVDLHSFLLKTMDHNITSLTRCRVAPAPHAALKRISEAHPHLTRLLWLNTLLDAAIHRRWLTAMGRQSALGHTAHLMCELLVRQREVGLAEADSFRMPLTQTRLADALGLSSVHTNRVVQELRDLRLVEWKGERVTILDWDGLARLAEFDPAYLNLQNEPR